MDTIGIGIVGFGFMGRTHALACQHARQAGTPCVLRAIVTGARGAGAAGANQPGPRDVDLIGVRIHEDVDAMLDDATIDAVSICTWTDTHVDLTRRALEAGKHVLVEKPLALHSSAVEPLPRIAREAERVCMPAMCMRFWPGWPWLRDRILAGTFGAPLSLSLIRRAARPDWASFYADPARSGGALFDLHVHDVDMLYWCFGDPRSIDARGDVLSVRTRYRFAGAGVRAEAEGCWSIEPGFPFTMRYEAVFEEAIASFDLARDPVLSLTRHERTESVSLAGATAYELQLRHFVEVIADGGAPRATLEDALAVTRILEAERDELDRGHR